MAILNEMGGGGEGGGGRDGGLQQSIQYREIFNFVVLTFRCIPFWRLFFGFDYFLVNLDFFS